MGFSARPCRRCRSPSPAFSPRYMSRVLRRTRGSGGSADERGGEDGLISISMAVHRITSLRILFYLCFPLFLIFRFYRCFTYPPESANPSSSSSSRPAAVADRTTKKLRKPYTITKSRDRWTAEEHERFLDALLL